MRLIRRIGGKELYVGVEGSELRWAQVEHLNTAWLDDLRRIRSIPKRAPMGDSHGAWQKLGEVPTSAFFQEMPIEAWGDKKYLAKMLNGKWRIYRTDGEHRQA